MAAVKPPVKGERFVRGPVPDGPTQARLAWAYVDSRCEVAQIVEVLVRGGGSAVDADASMIDLAYRTWRGHPFSDALPGGMVGASWEAFMLQRWCRP